MIFQITPSAGEVCGVSIESAGEQITIRPTGFSSMAEAFNACFPVLLRMAKTGDWVVFLHDDAQVTSERLELALYDVSNDASCGVVGAIGCKTLTIDGRWWLDNDRFGQIIQGEGDAANMILRAIDQAEPAASVDGCFMAIPYRTLMALGEFDESFTGWHYYDADLCTRAAKQGYINYIAPILVRHKSGGDLNDDWFESRKLFAKKWEGQLPGDLVS